MDGVAPARTDERTASDELLAVLFRRLHRDAQNPWSNSPSPVYRCLPAEILAVIFIHNACNSYRFEGYSVFSPAAPRWVNVSYVCRHWRDAALDCPILWTYIPTTSRRWTQELLARSEKAPLKICLTFATENRDRLPQYLSIVEQVTSHSERIQELCIYLNDTNENGYRLFSKFLSSRVPCLQHLQITNLNVPEELLFAGDTPALHTLVLECCALPWYSLGLSSITSLDLDSISVPFHLNMAQCLAMLRRMPHLIHLSLCHALAGAGDFLSNEEVDATPIVNLSHLSNMSITAPISTITALLSCVNIPLTTVIKLRCSVIEGRAHAKCMQLASRLAQRISNFPSLLFSSSGGTSLVFRTSERTYSSDRSRFTFSDHTPYLQVNFTAFAEDSFRILSNVCRSIPLTNIQSIHFVPPPLSLDFWSDILGRLPNIRHIKLSQGYLPDIACALLGNRDGNADRGQNEVLAPALEELELYQIDLLGDEDINIPPPDLQLLFDVISTRRGTRCGLTFTECHVETVEGPGDLDLIGWWDDTKFKVACSISSPTQRVY